MRLPDSSTAHRTKANGSQYSYGVAASLVAEAVFVGMVMLVAWLRGQDPWMVTRVPASFLLGPEAVHPPGFVPGDVLVGLLMHLWLGVLVGLIYAALLPRLSLRPITGGMVTAAVLYGLGFWLLPQIFPHWLAPFWLPPTGRALQAGAHVVYGATFGFTFKALTAARR